jgi:hypothetical protein
VIKKVVTRLDEVFGTRRVYADGDTVTIVYTESTRTFHIVAVYPATEKPTELATVFKYTALDSEPSPARSSRPAR